MRGNPHVRFGGRITVPRLIPGSRIPPYTIEVSPSINGESVRLIGIDTPETVDPSEPVQPLGPGASEFTTDQLEGRRVALEFDQERVDEFGRPLAYVYPSQNELFNETLVRQGFAQVATFPPNTRYEDRFLAAQEEAREACRGIWGLPANQQRQLADRGNDLGATAGQCSGEQPEQEESESIEARETPNTGGVPLAIVAAVLLALGISIRLVTRVSS